tara:strand:+ start:125 stop:901 length:777 start_codon:yes stop_codon:yes gene_type:complete
MNSKFKKILVTGSTSGLGRDLSLTLKDQKGIYLICIGRNKQKFNYLKKRIKKNVLFLKQNLNNISNIKNLILKLKKKSLLPDVVIHCMGGGLGLRSPLLESKNWDLLFKTNFLSGVELNNQLINSKRKSQKLHIIHVSGIASLLTGMGSIGLSSTKFMLIPYVSNMFKYARKFNIKINCILPGGFMSSEGSFFRLKKKNYSGYKNYIYSKTLKKKLMKSKDIQKAICDLVFKKNSDLNGYNLIVDYSKSLENYKQEKK